MLGNSALLDDAQVINLEARRGGPRTARLTVRERQVLAELARGRRTDEAAQALFLSPHTVRAHLRTALWKLGARTRTQAVAIAVSEGAVSPDV